MITPDEIEVDAHFQCEDGSCVVVSRHNNNTCKGYVWAVECYWGPESSCNWTLDENGRSVHAGSPNLVRRIMPPGVPCPK